MACELQDLFLLFGSSQRLEYVCAILLLFASPNNLHLAQAMALAFKCALSAKYDADSYIDTNTYFGLIQSASFLFMFASSFLSVAVYQVFGRLLWLYCPPRNLNFDTLKLPPHHVTNLAITIEIFTNIFLTASNVTLILIDHDNGIYSSVGDEGYTTTWALAVTGAGIQVCGRLYLLGATLKIMEDSKKWSSLKATSIKMKYGHRPLLKVLSVSGALLTVG
jgi:hypothetical protein